MTKVPISFTAFKREYAGLPPALLKNRFFEKNPAQADGAAMIARPATADLTELGSGPIRGIFSLPGLFNGSAFVVSGSTLYRYEPDGTVIPCSGAVIGSGEVSMAGVAGANYERLFIADGTLLQVYQGGTRASGVLTAGEQIPDGTTIRIGDTYYQWKGSVTTGSGTLADPWKVLIGTDLADSLANMVATINFTGTPGVTFSSNLAGQNTDVSATSTATDMTVTAKVDLAAGNSIVTEVTTGLAGGLVVAVAGTGTGNRVMTSTDGIAWTIRTSAANNQWRDVAWSPSLGLFAAVSATGTGNRVMTSPDGITWTVRTSAVDNSWRSVAWSPSLALFAAVASTGTGDRVMTSPDGITWTARTSAADYGWQSIVWADSLGLFVAVANNGASGRAMTSPDGITWTLQAGSATSNAMTSVAWSPSLQLLCAVATTGTGSTLDRVLTSPDGITWTQRTAAKANSWSSVTWSQARNLFVAVSTDGTGDRVMTSPDGITWTSRTSAADNDWEAVDWVPALNLFVATASTGTGNRVMTSPDGISWTTRTSAADNSWFGLANFSTAGVVWGASTLTGGGTHALSGVAVPDGLPPVAVAALKSFVLVAIGESDRFYWIEPAALSIDALNFATAESQPDDVLTVTVVGDTAWFIGEGSTEVWYATGNSAAPFSPVGGRVYDRGAIEGTVVNVKGVVFLVGGDRVVYAIAGGPQRVSDHAVEEQIRKYLGAS